MSTSDTAPAVRLLSIGGVVLRNGDSGPEVALCGHIDGAGYEWGLPKGTPEPGETRTQTAIREVQEETGLEVVIDEYIGDIKYSFPWPKAGGRDAGNKRSLAHKTVLFYLMSATGGSTDLHDHEFDDVQWFPADTALRSLKYDNEAAIVKDGLEMASSRA